MSSEFSFASLPWIVQKRFTEICDPQTMNKFKQASPQLQQLAKNRKIVKRVQISCHKHPECKPNKCKCIPGHCYQNVKIADIQNIEVMEQMQIDLARTKVTKELIQSFSFIASELDITSFDMEFDALKMLLQQSLKRFSFIGVVFFKNFEQDFAYLMDRMDNIDSVIFTMIFDKNGMRKEMEKIIKNRQVKDKKMFDFWFCNDYRFGICNNY